MSRFFAIVLGLAGVRWKPVTVMSECEACVYLKQKSNLSWWEQNRVDDPTDHVPIWFISFGDRVKPRCHGQTFLSPS